MKAMVITDFGSPEVFAEREVEKPTPAQGELLVQVCATSVNPADCGVRQGRFGRMLGQPIELPAILGFDVSGVVEAVGEGVAAFAPGDEVYYAIALPSQGANAEYHVTPVTGVARKPANLSHPEAAAVPVAGGTAWAALMARANLRLAETVLIHGAAGGVGSFAVQIAQAAGAYSFATCGGYDAQRVQALGANRTIDYRNEDFIEILQRETRGEGVDVVLDTVGGEVMARSLPVTKAQGRAVTITGVQGDFNLAIGKNITIHFTHLDQPRTKLDALRTLIERHQLKPLISHVFPLSEVAAAHRLVERGGEGVYGKVVVEVKAQGSR